MGKDNDEAAGGFGSVFRDRLTYLMNGNNVYGKPVNTQELADEIDISRPAVRKYLKPNDRREVTVPSALVVSRIARDFRTTPNFLLGFDEACMNSIDSSVELPRHSSWITSVCALCAFLIASSASFSFASAAARSPRSSACIASAAQVLASPALMIMPIATSTILSLICGSFPLNFIEFSVYAFARASAASFSTSCFS